MNLTDWAPLKFVHSALLSQVRLAYVFGTTGQEAFIITKDDEVFACGLNYSGCLGLGIEGPQIEPIRVPELCQNKIIGFACSIDDSGAFLRAYTSDGMTYCWGKYPTKSRFIPTPMLTRRAEFKSTIQEVVAGPNHGLILTYDGEVFSYGSNERGQLGRLYSNVPGLIEGNLKKRIITKVSCGAFFSVAILDNGEIYAWGHNTHGQLGVGDERDNEDKARPNKISALTDIKIENIICGESYVLAVSNIGELYSWGQNDVGQLGLGHTIPRFKPERVDKIEKVIDVAATAYGSTSAAMGENNEVYMWGDCGGMNFTEPTKTRFETLFDVFAYYANPRIMHRPMLRTFQLDSVSESIRNAFDDSETSDLTIVADGKEIFVHKAILMLRSDYFKVLLQKPWLEEDKKVLTINQNYDALYAYLQYLYSGNFKGKPEAALESLKIAHEYHDLAWKAICENHVRRNITVENVANLYNIALKLDTKDLAKDCALFAGKNIGNLIDTPGFSEWDADALKQFIRDCHKQKIFRY